MFSSGWRAEAGRRQRCRVHRADHHHGAGGHRRHRSARARRSRSAATRPCSGRRSGRRRGFRQAEAVCRGGQRPERRRTGAGRGNRPCWRGSGVSRAPNCAWIIIAGNSAGAPARPGIFGRHRRRRPPRRSRASGPARRALAVRRFADDRAEARGGEAGKASGSICAATERPAVSRFAGTASVATSTRIHRHLEEDPAAVHPRRQRAGLHVHLQRGQDQPRHAEGLVVAPRAWRRVVLGDAVADVDVPGALGSDLVSSIAALGPVSRPMNSPIAAAGQDRGSRRRARRSPPGKPARAEMRIPGTSVSPKTKANCRSGRHAGRRMPACAGRTRARRRRRRCRHPHSIELVWPASFRDGSPRPRLNTLPKTSCTTVMLAPMPTSC